MKGGIGRSINDSKGWRVEVGRDGRGAISTKDRGGEAGGAEFDEPDEGGATLNSHHSRNAG